MTEIFVALITGLTALFSVWIKERKTARQFKNNGGSTLRDAIDRIEHRQTSQQETLNSVAKDQIDIRQEQIGIRQDQMEILKSLGDTQKAATDTRMALNNLEKRLIKVEEYV